LTDHARQCGRCRRGRASGTAAPAVPRPGPAARAGSAPAAASRPRAPPATRSRAHRRRSPACYPRILPTYAPRENPDKTRAALAAEKRGEAVPCVKRTYARVCMGVYVCERERTCLRTSRARISRTAVAGGYARARARNTTPALTGPANRAPCCCQLSVGCVADS